MPSSTTSTDSLSKRVALVAFGLVLAITSLELALRATGWLFLHMRRPKISLPANAARHYVVLCIGESTTADLGLLGGHETYPAQLEFILNHQAEGAHFTVVNGGRPAATTDTILERLPGQLDEQHVDLVVAMMGINDGESASAAYQISGRLRVWKLAKMLWLNWSESRANEIGGRRLRAPTEVFWSGQIAWDHILEGKYDEARDHLERIIEQDQWLTQKSRANGMLAVASWQEGNDVEGDRYHGRFLESEVRVPRSRTVANYRTLRALLAERNIPLVAVQYPGLPVELLRHIAENDPNVVFVDNEHTFLEAVKTRPAREVYRDLFGGVFGHLTPHGNLLLAANVAQAILEMVPDAQASASRASSDE